MQKNDLLVQGQYGSRKSKTAIDQVLHKWLMYDTLQLSQQPGFLCSNDTKSCYNRVHLLSSITMLVFRGLRVKSPSVESMLKSIRTEYGDSTFTLHNNGYLIPFQGVL